MAGIPRIELDELFAKYGKHPDLLDLFVEGDFDRDLLNFLFDEMGYAANISVYAVDAVDVPDDLISSMGLNCGSNKHRVMALAKTLAAKQLENSNVSCLVDADTDRLLKNIFLSRHLIYTDYTCMEMYCLNAECLRKFFVLVCNLGESALEEFLSYADEILPVQFCLRAVNERLKLNASVPPFQSGVKKKQGVGRFDSAAYINAYVDREQLHARRGEIDATFAELAERLGKDRRNKVHGHDFVELLFEYLAGKGIMKFHGKEEEIRRRGGRMLSSSLVAARVFKEAVFQRVEGVVKRDEVLWPLSDHHRTARS